MYKQSSSMWNRAFLSLPQKETILPHVIIYSMYETWKPFTRESVERLYRLHLLFR